MSDPRHRDAGYVGARSPTRVDASPGRDPDRLHHRSPRRDRPSAGARTRGGRVLVQTIQRDGTAEGTPCSSWTELNDSPPSPEEGIWVELAPLTVSRHRDP